MGVPLKAIRGFFSGGASAVIVFGLLASAGLSGLSAAHAQGIQRVDASGLACTALQDIIEAEGAAIVRSRSPRSGMVLSERYVSRRGFCLQGEITRFRSVQTRDTEFCSVKICALRSGRSGNQ